MTNLSLQVDFKGLKLLGRGEGSVGVIIRPVTFACAQSSYCYSLGEEIVAYLIRSEL